MAPAASVLMCVYNERADFLDQAIQSIVNQTFEDFELVIVDDGSTLTETKAIIERWQKRDSRIQLCRTSNQGLTKALNYGLGHCKGEIVFRHDSDDWSLPHRLATQWEFLSTHADYALVGSDYWLCDEDGRRVFRCRLPRTEAAISNSFSSGQNAFCHGAVAFRKNVIRALGSYREALRCAQDLDLFWRVSEISKTANVPQPLYNHRRASGSVSVQKTELQDACAACARILAAMRKETGAEDFDSAWRQAREAVTHPARQIHSLLRKGDHLMIAGQYREAARIYLGALHRRPSSTTAILKLVRLLAFVLCPLARAQFFRTRPI